MFRTRQALLRWGRTIGKPITDDANIDAESKQPQEAYESTEQHSTLDPPIPRLWPPTPRFLPSDRSERTTWVPVELTAGKQVTP